jgi:DNA-binding CsgD family transcriptional regulator
MAIDTQRRVLLANGAATRALGMHAGIRIRKGSLIIANREADEQFHRLVSEEVGQLTRRGVCRGLRVPRQIVSRDWLLTRCEIDVLQRVVRHESTPEIARHLCRSDETVKACLKRIFSKCDARSRSDLIALTHRISLLSAPSGRAAKKYPVGGSGSRQVTEKLEARDSEKRNE